jgi:hypothetical protein
MTLSSMSRGLVIAFRARALPCISTHIFFLHCHFAFVSSCIDVIVTFVGQMFATFESLSLRQILSSLVIHDCRSRVDGRSFTIR